MPDSTQKLPALLRGGANAPAAPDKGPWLVDEWSDGIVVLQSDDFEHDVALEISGDFGSKESKLEYARSLAAWMNAHLPPRMDRRGVVAAGMATAGVS